MKIGDIATFSKGASIPRNRISAINTIPYIHYGDVYKLYHRVVNLDSEFDHIAKVSANERFRNDQLLDTGDIVYNLTSETKDDIGKAVLIENTTRQKFLAGTETTVLKIIRKDLIAPGFLNYILMSNSYLSEFRRFATGTKVYRVHPRAIKKIKIPVPPLTEQKRIVSILDRFDMLVNDITIGLPAELAARRKQYEYYRDRLLTFEPRPESGEPSVNPA